MTAKTVLKRATAWNFLIIAASFLIAAPQVSAQDYGSENGYGGQQQQQQNYQPPQNYQQQVEISNQDLEKFVEAQEEVEEIRTAYSNELGQTGDTEKARQLQEKYSGQMVESIQEKGMSVQKYNEISLAMQQSPELRKKIQELAD